MQRDKAEQIEKARLRHKHALAQLQLEEVRFSECLLVTSQYSRTLLVYCYWGTEYNYKQIIATIWHKNMLGYYLFLVAYSFPRATCMLLETVRFSEQIMSKTK